MFHERAQYKESPAMNAAHSPVNSALSDNEEHLSVSRALGELQARRPIRVNAPGEVLFALPVEGLEPAMTLFTLSYTTSDMDSR